MDLPTRVFRFRVVEIDEAAAMNDSNPSLQGLAAQGWRLLATWCRKLSEEEDGATCVLLGTDKYQ
jgi:hypothetical protein